MKNYAKIISTVLAAATTLSASALVVNAIEDDSWLFETEEYQQPIVETTVETETEEDTSVALFEDSSSSVLFTGGAVTPSVELYAGGTRLVQGTDYDLSYSNNKNVGQATITVTFKGNYTGTRYVNFNIVARGLDDSKVTITGVDERYTYTRSAITPEPTIVANETGETLVKGTDYDLSYENNTNNGEATINIAFKGNYSGSASTTFQIGAMPVDIDNLLISTIADQTFTGSEIKPEPTVKYGALTYVAGDSDSTTADFYYTYENNVRAGTATVKITFINNYSGETSRTFNIVAQAVTDPTPIVANPDPSNPSGVYMPTAVANRTYTGSQHTPQPELYYGNGTMLEEGIDYDLSYSDNTNAGTATITITYKHDLSGTQTVNFTIDPKDVTDDDAITFSIIPDQTYTAGDITPEPEVRDTDR